MDKKLEGYKAKLKEVDVKTIKLEREIDNLPVDADCRADSAVAGHKIILTSATVAFAGENELYNPLIPRLTLYTYSVNLVRQEPGKR